MNADVLDERPEAVRAARQLIAGQVLADGDNGLRVLRMAGGRGWDGTSKAFVGFNSGGAAARAARRLYQLRSRTPSRTSVEEAAAAATLAMVQSVRRWDKVTPSWFCGSVGSPLKWCLVWRKIQLASWSIDAAAETRNFYFLYTHTPLKIGESQNHAIFEA